MLFDLKGNALPAEVFLKTNQVWMRWVKTTSTLAGTWTVNTSILYYIHTI